MPITAAPASASARANWRWLDGKKGSTNTTFMSGMLAGRAAYQRPRGPRSRMTSRQDAELVALGVGENDPALVAGLPDVGVPGTQLEQPANLVVLVPVGRVDVEVEPVLDGLALGHTRECQRRRNRAKAVPSFRHHRRPDCHNAVLGVLHLIAKDRAPEPSET